MKGRRIQEKQERRETKGAGKKETRRMQVRRRKGG